MPVDVADDEPGAVGRRWVDDPDSHPHRIVSFLAATPGTGITPKEIAEATEVPRGSVGTTRSRLEDQGLLRHTEPYWAIVEDGRLAAFEGMIAGSRAAAERGEEGWADLDTDAFASAAAMDEWRERQGEG